MDLLLDTHAFIWWSEDNRRLSPAARQTIGDEENRAFISAASAWEIATKHRLGKLPEAAALALDIPGSIISQNFEELPITVDDASRAGALPGPLRDPFDRMLIAQAIGLNLVLVSNESLFDRYGIRRLW